MPQIAAGRRHFQHDEAVFCRFAPTCCSARRQDARVLRRMLLRRRRIHRHECADGFGEGRRRWAGFREAGEAATWGSAVCTCSSAIEALGSVTLDAVAEADSSDDEDDDEASAAATGPAPTSAAAPAATAPAAAASAAAAGDSQPVSQRTRSSPKRTRRDTRGVAPLPDRKRARRASAPPAPPRSSVKRKRQT